MTTVPRNKLNTLERSIVAGEDGVEDARWAQAEEVVRRLDKGESQRDIAATWINLRTGKPYSHNHVGYVAKIWRGNPGSQNRPLWTDAYAQAKGFNDAATRSRESQQAWPPENVETAKKFVANLMNNASDTVQDTVFHELKLARAGEDRSPAARKAAEASADEAVAPIKRAVATSGIPSYLNALEEAHDGFKDALEEGAEFSEPVLSKVDLLVSAIADVAMEARLRSGVKA